MKKTHHRRSDKLRLVFFAAMMLAGLLFFCAAAAGTLELPAGLTQIEDEVFIGTESVATVIVPDGVTKIGEGAFADSSVSSIVLPDTLTSIATDAFRNVEDLEISAPEGSLGEVYRRAYENGLLENGEGNILLTPLSLTGDQVNQLCTVTVNFRLDSEAVAQPYTGSFAYGTGTVASRVTIPKIVGYDIDVSRTAVDAGSTNFIYNLDGYKFTYNFDSIAGNVVVDIYYKPALVQYKVNYYWQKVAGFDYELKESVNRTGYTGSRISENHENTKDRYQEQGFYGLMFAPLEIAADGSTVVQIYYDRYYYLVSYHLNGGTGVNPVYARVGAEIRKQADPTRPGYDFLGWYTAQEGGEKVDPVTVMPAENKDYYAHWQMKTAEVNYSVDFWYENADDDDYTRVASITRKAPGGTVVSSNDYRDYTGDDFKDHDKTHFTYNEGLAETRTVASDGSTILNVYFTRNRYTFRFLRGMGNNSQETVGEHTLKYEQLITNEMWPLPQTLTTCWTGNPGGSKLYVEGNTFGKGVSWNHQIGAKVLEEKERPVKFSADYITEGGVHNFYLIYYKSNDRPTEYTVKYNLQSLDNPNEFTEDTTQTVVISPKGQSGDNYYYSTGLYAGFEPDETRATYDTTRKAWYASPDANRVYNLYYVRVKSNFTVRNLETNLLSTSAAYGEPLGSMTIGGTPLSSYVPANPIDYPDYTYQFGGWYTTPDWLDGTKVDMSSATMPGEPLIIYAKWERIPRQVEVYLTADLDQLLQDTEVLSGTIMQEKDRPAEPTYGQYIFAGWFYMDNGEEHAFLFDSMPVNQDMKVYAKWSSNVVVDYTISFVYKRAENDIGSTGVDGDEIAERITGMMLAGASITFEAKTGSQLRPEYRTGYFPLVSSHTLVASMDEAQNNYTFIYHWLPEAPYRVRYIDTATGEPLLPEKLDEHNTYSVVTEYAPNIVGYVVDAYQKRLVLALSADGETGDDAQNIITFYYTPDKTHALVTERHMLQLHDNIEQIANDEAEEDIGSMVIRSRRQYENYVLDYVKVYDGTQTEEQAARIDAAAWNDNQEYELGDTGLNFVFYYRSLSFRVIGTVSGETVYSIADKSKDYSHFDATKNVPAGYLYAGLYQDAAYTQPYTEICGLDFEPQDGVTYYVKEIPDGYLKPKIVTGYLGGMIKCTYMVAAVDSADGYQSVGFMVNDETRGGAWSDDVAYTRIRLRKTSTDPDDKSDANYIIYSFSQIYGSLGSGYLAVQPYPDLSMNTQFTYRPYFVTRDGVMVKGTIIRTINTGDMTKTGLTVVADDPVKSETSRYDSQSSEPLMTVYSIDQENR